MIIDFLLIIGGWVLGWVSAMIVYRRKLGRQELIVWLAPALAALHLRKRSG